MSGACAKINMNFHDTPKNYPFPWYVRLLFALQRRRYGQELEPARLWGRTPRAFLAFSLLYAALDRKSSPLDPALRSLIQVRVSQINWCAFCTDINSSIALTRGVSEQKLAALAEFKSSVLYDGKERAALIYAEVMTDSNDRPDAALVSLLQEYFNHDAIIELTALIAFQNMSSKFNAALGVPAQGFCRNTKAR